MARFILLSFAFLAWAFYEMSGGAEFEPASARLTNVRDDPLKRTVTTAEVAPDATRQSSDLEANVTRVSLNLTSVQDVLSGGTTRPSRNVEPLPQVSNAAINTDQPEAVVTNASLTSGELPASRDDEVAAIIPSLVDGADATAVVQVASIGNASATEPTDIRAVTGNRVNVRGGPSTAFEVVTGLVRGDEVEILEDTGDGWVRMRPLDGGPEGWIADFLLSDG